VVSITNSSLRRGRARRTVYVVGVVAALAGGLLGTAGSSLASSRHAKTKICKGSPTKPGQLTGKVAGNVTVKGACEVSHGSATVEGSVRVSAGGVLVAAFGHDDKTGSGHSNLTVKGNLVIGKGGAAILGCEAAHFPCIDDNQMNPTLSNKIKIAGNVTAKGALAVILHVAKVGGNLSQRGGGGGTSCAPPFPGIFSLFMSPQYSDYEDISIHGKLTISTVTSCWLGVLRDHIGKSFQLTRNAMGDPDAIEIGDNHIAGNLACTGNTNVVPISAAVWDTSDITDALYPRVLKPNTVKGKRSGQCVRSTPTTMGGAYGAPNTF
jgi:hypothetical protein